MREKIIKYSKIAGIVLLAALYLYFLIFNQFQSGSGFKSELERIQEENSNLEKRLSQLEDSEAILKSLEAEAFLVEEKLNHDLSDGAFLVNLTEKITKEKLILASYAVSPVEDFESFYALPSRLTLVGNYRGVMNVLNYMEYQPNMTQIQDLVIRKLEEEKEIETYYGTAEELGTLTETILVERDPSTVLPGESPYEEIEITRAIEVDLMEMFNGRVIAECTYVLYTVPTPEAKIQLQNIKSWKTGNQNPFR
jgi:hypothetical protein